MRTRTPSSWMVVVVTTFCWTVFSSRICFWSRTFSADRDTARRFSWSSWLIVAYSLLRSCSFSLMRVLTYYFLGEVICCCCWDLTVASLSFWLRKSLSFIRFLM